MSNTFGPSLQQIKANSRVPDEIKGQDDKVNDPVVLTTTPSQAPDSKEALVQVREHRSTFPRDLT